MTHLHLRGVQTWIGRAGPRPDFRNWVSSKCCPSLLQKSIGVNLGNGTMRSKQVEGKRTKMCQTSICCSCCAWYCLMYISHRFTIVAVFAWRLWRLLVERLYGQNHAISSNYFGEILWHPKELQCMQPVRRSLLIRSIDSISIYNRFTGFTCLCEPAGLNTRRRLCSYPEELLVDMSEAIDVSGLTA